jgi:GH25 family lysozyme M1 (1,4-beta-N-acetylmuramidase)
MKIIEMNKAYKIKKAVVAFLLADLLICVGIIIGVNLVSENSHPVAAMATDRELTLGVGTEKAEIEDNYWDFVHKSYILIGTAPNYTYYKIVSQLDRNDYDPELFYEEDNGFMYYHDEDGNRLSKVAVDVSTFQGDIDWNQLAATGVELVMIRAGLRGYGNGEIKEDSAFRRNVEGATAAGLSVGVYFFSQALNADEGAEEAQFVLDLVSGYGISGPIAIDTEFVDDSEARTFNLDITSRTDSIISFCDTVDAAGYQSMIYANRNWFVQNLDLTRLYGYKLWVAHYVDTPDFPYLYNGWQYTETATIAGVQGNIDLNVWIP